MVEEYIFDMMHGVETGFCFEEHCSRLHLIVEDKDSFVHSYLNFMEDVGGRCLGGGRCVGTHSWSHHLVCAWHALQKL